MLAKFVGISGVTVLLALSLSLAFGQVSTSAGGEPVSLSTSTAITLVRHTPRKAARLHPDQVIDNVTVTESNNWSGYAVTGALFTQARGSWIVPAVDCRAVPNSSVSFWVGIDGWDNDTVEQTGTDSDCNGETPVYYAWYEFVPAGGVTITSVPLSPGDRMSAEVFYNGSDFVVTMSNETTGQSFILSHPPGSAKRASAEWIAEANGYFLSDFGTVSFGEDYTSVGRTNYAADSKTSGQIGDFGGHVWKSIIVNSGVEDAMPSSLSPDGSSFMVTWESD
jgi:hypothetical protein